MVNKKKNRRQQRQSQRQRQETSSDGTRSTTTRTQQPPSRMGNQPVVGGDEGGAFDEPVSRSASYSDDGDTTVSEGEPPRLNLSRRVVAPPPEQHTQQSAPQQQQQHQHRTNVVAELSERFLLSKKTEPSSSLLLLQHSPSGASLLPTDEPTTRTCSPTPSCCYSEEGQEVVVSGTDGVLQQATGDLSSIDTTGADVNLELTTTTGSPPLSSLHHNRFLEEKKDEDLGFASSASLSSSRNDHPSSEDEEDDDENDDDGAPMKDLQDGGDDHHTDRHSGLMGSPYPHGSLLEGSPDDSGFFTASQSSDVTTARPSSLLEGPEEPLLAPSAEELALSSSHSLPHLDDDDGSSSDVEAAADNDCTPRTRPASNTSSSSSAARVRIRRRSDYDSVVSTLQSNSHFALARGRLERHSLTGASPPTSPDKSPPDSKSTHPTLENRYRSPHKSLALETTVDTVCTSMTEEDEFEPTIVPREPINNGPLLTVVDTPQDGPPLTADSAVSVDSVTAHLAVTEKTPVRDDAIDCHHSAVTDTASVLDDAIDQATSLQHVEGEIPNTPLPARVTDVTVSRSDAHEASVPLPTAESIAAVETTDESSAKPSSVEAARRAQGLSAEFRESVSSVSSESPLCPSSTQGSIDARESRTTTVELAHSESLASDISEMKDGPDVETRLSETKPIVPDERLKPDAPDEAPDETNHDQRLEESHPQDHSGPDSFSAAEQFQLSESYSSDQIPTNPIESEITDSPEKTAASREAQDLSLPDLNHEPKSKRETPLFDQPTPHEQRDGTAHPSGFQICPSTDDATREGDIDALHSSFSSAAATQPALLDIDAATAAASAVLKGDTPKADKQHESPKFVKTILGSPTLAERKAALYTPRRSGKRDPTAVLQLAERPASMFTNLVAIESEDDEDCDVHDASSVTPRQLERTLTLGGGSRSVTSCASRSLASEHESPPNSPGPAPLRKSEVRVKGPTISLREGLRRIDSAPIGTVISKECGEGASVTSLPTPGPSSSPIIFRTPLSISKRQPTEPKRMSDLIRLDVWSRNPSVVETALEALSHYAADDKNHGTMARTGALLAIVRAMETHVDHSGIQVQACRCLEKLALDHDNELAIGEVGGIEAILGAMMSHSENSLVQEAAWAALWNLTCGNADHQMVVDAAGGIEVLVQCMMRHSDHPDVQKNACGTLANLCLDNEERLTALAEADGFVAISMALQKHWRNPDVRNEASYALTDRKSVV